MSDRKVTSQVRVWIGVASLALGCATGAATAVQPPSAPAEHVKAPSADLATIIDGVKEIAAPGTSGVLAVWGERAFVAAIGKGDRDRRVPVLAAGTHGRGRLIAFPHTGLLSEDAAKVADTGRMIENAVRWAAGAKQGPGPIKVGLLNCNLSPSLTDRGFTASVVKKQDLTDAILRGYDALCIVGNDFDEAQVQALARFVESGGGVLAAQTAWAWKPPEGKSLSDNPLNTLFAPAGIAWTGAYSRKTGETGFSTDGAPDPMLHAARALDAIVAAEKTDGKPGDDVRQAARTALDAVRALPVGDTLLRPRIEQLMREHAVSLSPSEKEPMAESRPLLRLLLAAQIEQSGELPARGVRPHGASTAFPGPVAATASRVTRTVTIDPAVADWQSTGLYAAPGEVVMVTIPETAIKRGMRIRIGCHKDELWHTDSWKRVPQITRAFALGTPKTEAACAFGGPIYIDNPKEAAGEPIDITIGNAV